MIRGGVTEIIAYFSGYLHLLEQVQLDRAAPHDPALLLKVGKTEFDHTDPAGLPFTPATLDSESISYTVLTQNHYPLFNGWLPHPGGPEFFGQFAANFTPVPFTLTLQLSPLSSLEFGPALPEADPSQLWAQIEQVNKLVANQLVDVDPTSQAATLNAAGSGEQIDHMMVQADSYLPSGFAGLQTIETNGPVLLQSNLDAQSLVDAHDSALAGGSAPQITLQPGEYINGVFSPVATASVPTVDPPDYTLPPTNVMGQINSGLEVIAGSNTLVNSAGIIDGNVQHLTMLVVGNAYSTNAIFQTNILHDVDSITTAAGGAPLNIATGGNILNNIADFQTPHLISITGTSSTNTSWHVDVVQGNFYNMNVCVQTNVMAAGSTSFQTTETSFYKLVTGGHEQINGYLCDSYGSPYDLIVVEGSYNHANLIFQNNIILNDDVVKAILDTGTSTGMSISTGGNLMTNYASITDYGPSQVGTLSADLAAHAMGIDQKSFDSLIASLTPDNGTHQLNVLVVTGDYYDVNVISQNNVLSDPNTAIQMMTAAGGEGTTSTESISTGANQTINVAQIVSAGTLGSQLVGGQYYSDSLLVQANITTEDSHVTTQDPNALASEVIAFIGSGDTDTSAAATHTDIPGTSDSAHHSMLASLAA